MDSKYCETSQQQIHKRNYKTHLDSNIHSKNIDLRRNDKLDDVIGIPDWFYPTEIFKR